MCAEGRHCGDFSLPEAADAPDVIAARNQGAAYIAQWAQEWNTAVMQIPTSNAADLFNLNYTLGGYTQVVNDTLPGSSSFRDARVLEPTAEYSNGADVI